VYASTSTLLRLIAAPFAYFSGPSRQEIEAAENFRQADDILKNDNLSKEQVDKAYEHLFLSVADGNGQALLHMGGLMLGLPDRRWRVLFSHVSFDERTGIIHLEEAQRKGVSGAKELLRRYDNLILLNNTILMANGLDAEVNLDKARSLVRAAVAKKGPHAAFYLAEAILKQDRSSYPWMFVEELDSYERRVKALPLLDLALQAQIQGAQILMDELVLEGRVYEAVCAEIMQNREREIAGLKLGEAGFQEAYIDEIFQSQRPIVGVVLNRGQAFVLKKAMSARVDRVFQYLSTYSQYVAAYCHASGRVIDLNESLRLIVRDPRLLGQFDAVIPSVATAFGRIRHEASFHDFRVVVPCPVTPLDADTALRKLTELHDDFTGPIVE